MDLGKEMAILDGEWGRNLAPREGQKIPLHFTGKLDFYTFFFLISSLNICFGCLKETIL